MRLIFCALAAAAVFIPNLVNANCSATGCYNVQLEQLMPTDGNGTWIQTSGNESLANCTVDSGIFLKLNASAPKEIYASLLAAFMSDKPVSITIVQGSNPCAVSYVSIDR